MPSYAIAGSSRGIGLEFVNQLSKIPSNTVFAIVRSPERATVLQQLAQERATIHILEADVTNPESLYEAAATASKVTGGKLDVFIHNAVMYDEATSALTPSRLPADREGMQNAFDSALSSSIYGAAWTTNAFLPLIEQGEEKKIVHISSPMADIDFIRKTRVTNSVAYSVGKAGMNILIAKYAAELAPKRIKALAISPGWVDTWEGPDPKPAEELAFEKALLSKIQEFYPDVKGRISKEESVRKQLNVISNLDEKLSGAFISQNGNQHWF